MDLPLPLSSTMESSLELFEQKFRRVEEESERRALDDPNGPPARDIPGPTHRRKKPAVSVSQFGKPEGKGEDGVQSSAPSPLSAVASKSTFYHTLANPRSVDSLLSGNSEEIRDTEEEEHEIRVERITGRQTLPKTVGALLPRRLASSKSQQIDYVSVNRGMVIDVSVETTTELSRLSSDLRTSTAYAARPRAATVDVLSSHGGLVERAKDFARKLRRKSRA